MYGNKIKLTQRNRQTGATTELFAKYFGTPNSIIIVMNPGFKEMLIQKINTVIIKDKESLSERIVVYRKNDPDFKSMLEKYNTWFLDTCSNDITKNMVNLAIDMNKTLIGHYIGDDTIKDYSEDEYKVMV